MGAFLGQLAGTTAQEVMTYMTIPSTFSRSPSIFQVHLGSGEVLHPGDQADTLVAFYQHSYEGRLHTLKDGGICFYDSDNVEEVKEERGIIHIGVPFTSATIEAIGGSAKSRGKNIFVLGLLCAAYQLDRDKMSAIMEFLRSELPLIVVNIQRGGPSTGLPTSVEQSDLMQAIYGSHGDAPRIVLAPKNVEDCFYTALEACRLARKYSTPVFILSDQAIATRLEAFEEPDLSIHWEDPVLDISERGPDFKPYPLDKITRHSPPGARSSGGKYPVVTSLEHDEWGHPSGNPNNHQKMTEKRRNKLVELAESLPTPHSPLPTPEAHGEKEGALLVIGWGSTYGPIKEATDRLNALGHEVGSINIRHVHPLPKGLGDLFDKYNHILVPKMNDSGMYGYGQLATLLRAKTCNPKIQALNKVQGISFRVIEITETAEALIAEA